MSGMRNTKQRVHRRGKRVGELQSVVRFPSPRFSFAKPLHIFLPLYIIFVHTCFFVETLFQTVYRVELIDPNKRVGAGWGEQWMPKRMRAKFCLRICVFIDLVDVFSPLIGHHGRMLILVQGNEQYSRAP
ncbi:hypothetical protein BDZ91DRAFT_713970 [Kalaharituber pfeilii]|nr:hypothetical protein BDZ91DRAFT_713970 [Kalaharituber pfeilii]